MRGENLPECRARQVAIGRIEDRRVEKIERLAAKLEPCSRRQFYDPAPPEYREITTHVKHTHQISDYAAILCGLDPGCLIFKLGSPVDLEIEAPDGRIRARDSTAIPGSSYMVFTDRSGHETATVIIPFPQPGRYKVRVISKPDARSTDTYTLIATRRTQTTVLAQDRPIAEIPPNGFEYSTITPTTSTLAVAPTSRQYSDRVALTRP